MAANSRPIDAQAEVRRLRSLRFLRWLGGAGIISGGFVFLAFGFRSCEQQADGGSLNSSGAMLEIFLIAFIAIAVGGGVRHIAEWASSAGRHWTVAVGVLGLGLAVAAPVALVVWYPQTQHAAVAAYDTTSGTVLWRSTTPATQLFSLRMSAPALEVVGRIDEGCDFQFATFHLDPATGELLGTTGGGDSHGPYVPGGSEIVPGDMLADGLKWAINSERIVSEHGWSIWANPLRGPVPAWVTPEITYLAKQGRHHLSCSR